MRYLEHKIYFRHFSGPILHLYKLNNKYFLKFGALRTSLASLVLAMLRTFPKYSKTENCEFRNPVKDEEKYIHKSLYHSETAEGLGQI